MLSIEQTMNMTLIELLTQLKTIKNIEAFLKPLRYDIKLYSDNIIGINYQEGINNIWRPKWSRETRGKFYYIGDDKVIELKGGLQRGIEILTSKHINSKIDQTQEMENNKSSIEQFDDVQQNIIKLFQNEINDIDGYITSKVDGSLIIVNVYPIKSEQYLIMREAIKSSNEFNKELAQYCYNHDYPLITISSKGTLLINDDMVDYFKSCINDPVEDFALSILCYYYQNEYTEYASFFFEGYCKDRTTNNGKIFTCLAISYDHNDLILLGAYHKETYYPHFVLPTNINFKQPFYMKINNVKQVYDMMNDLDDMVLGNKSYNQILHPEGFVFYTNQFSSGIYDYSKIKTILYYQCHKVKDYNIEKLLGLPDHVNNYYPIVKILKMLNNDIKPKLETIINKTYNLIIDEVTKKSTIIYSSFNDKAKNKVDGLKINDPTIFKIYINCNIDTLVLVLNSLNESKLYITEYVALIKSFLMKLQPWSNSSWVDKLSNMVDSKDELIIKLYDMVLFNGIDL